MKTILLVDDDTAILTVLARALGREGYRVERAESVPEATRRLAQSPVDLVVTDVTMPSGNGLDGLMEWHRLYPKLPVIVMSAHNMLLNAARAQDLGAVEFLPKPFDLALLVESVARALRRESHVQTDPQEGIVTIAPGVTLVGKSAAMQDVFRLLTRLISNDLTVLIQGESGTGKELVARALHGLSRRKVAPFIALNMAAIPRELIESALFGHEKGAFTGAHQRQLGAFERAQGGTLFLDEIGDMPMEAQTRLLRVLQEGEFSPIGSVRNIRTDVRIITATHRDLTRHVAEGSFREDLYYRLNVVPLPLPPLRERREDIAALVEYFIALGVARGLPQKTLDASALALLMDAPWKGNIRELENFIYRLLAVEAAPRVSAADIAPLLSASSVVVLPTAALPVPESTESFAGEVARHLRHFFATHGQELPAPGLYNRMMQLVEKPLLEQTLRATGGNQIRAAEILGINRNTLRKKMRELAIDVRTLLKEVA
ncbi:MAG: sigma 54-interacting transcriptional regulator [Alphaproteobacteria bacterium]